MDRNRPYFHVEISRRLLSQTEGIFQLSREAGIRRRIQSCIYLHHSRLFSEWFWRMWSCPSMSSPQRMVAHTWWVNRDNQCSLLSLSLNFFFACIWTAMFYLTLVLLQQPLSATLLNFLALWSPLCLHGVSSWEYFAQCCIELPTLLLPERVHHHPLKNCGYQALPLVFLYPK